MHIQPAPIDQAIYTAVAKVEQSLSALKVVRRSIAGVLPLAEAEALMDDVEDYLNIVGVRLRRALEVLTRAIDHAEAA